MPGRSTGMASRTYNPEKRAWRGKSYKKGGKRVRALRDAEAKTDEKAVKAKVKP